MRRTQSHILTTAQHHAYMQQLFPQFTYSWHQGRGVWRGALQPQSNGVTYQVRIAYKITDRPRVKVLHPEIRQDAPHLYPGKELCLYYPADRTWHPGLPIASTIVPMAAEWLFFYELWMESGTWWGPEAPHSPRVTNQSQ